mmetsp:Transcript_3488/g.7246  ORF Transcript_3488/g.7246 Transcript_3488/m.7246 type:complete len:252 (+) Transcript_3488:3006-3761(+)
MNWDHVESVIEKLNTLPHRDSMTADINRVADVWIEARGAPYLQHIVTTEYLTSSINALLRHSQNYRGQIKNIVHYEGVLVPSKTLRFYKYICDSVADMHEARYNYFTQTLWPKAREDLPPKALVFCSSYFEYIRLKNYFEDQDPGLMFISEYTPKGERQRNIAMLASDRAKAILITERLLYFRKLKLPELEALCVYSLPQDPSIFSTLLGFMKGEAAVLFSKFDGLELQRIVGDTRVGRMIQSSNDLFTFA